MEYIDYISSYCRDYRINTLKMTLSTMCEKTDTNVGTLSAFEHGRSKNIEHFIKYIEVSTNEQKLIFLSGFNKLMGV